MSPVGHGVVDHSKALADPITRFRNTSAYIFLIAFGEDEERRRIISFVNRAHGPVRSESYNAFDPRLQLWIAAVMWQGGRDIYERFLGPLDEDAAEDLYQQFAVYGTSLQVPPELWPADLAAFDEYWRNTLDNLVIDEKVRVFAHQLLSGGSAPWFVRAGMPLNRLITVGLLPPEVRRTYGFEWNDRSQKAFDILIGIGAPIYRILPRSLRHLPKRLVLRDARKRLASTDKRVAI